MKAILITYTISHQPISVQNQLRKRINGHNDRSHGGKYTYRREGILNNILHIKPSRSTIIVPLKESKAVLESLKEYGAQIKTYAITIDLQEFKK
jgi:hypothetical protein